MKAPRIADLKSENPAGRPGSQVENESERSKIFADLNESRKAYVTLQAQLALKGYTLSELTDSTLLICRWDRSAHCSDLAQVRAFYQRIGGAA